jgi:hypothetical protein
MGFGIEPALDTENDLVGILRVLLEVTLQKSKTVVVRLSVVLATIPTVAYVRSGSATLAGLVGEKTRMKFEWFEMIY